MIIKAILTVTRNHLMMEITTDTIKRKETEIIIKVTGQDFLMTWQKKMRVNNRFCRRKV